MNWCWVSLIVAVPNFITKSAADAGSTPRNAPIPQANTAAIASATRGRGTNGLTRRIARLEVMTVIPLVVRLRFKPLSLDQVNYNVSAQLANHLPSPHPGHACASRQARRVKVFSAVAHAVHQHLVLAAVDLDHRAVDEEGEIGGEINDEIGNLLGFDNPAERNACRGEFIGLFE